MTDKDNPLVSCICVTHNSLDHLRKCIQCFQQQTYPNKELILAFSAGNIAAADLVETLQDPSIRTLVFPSTQPLTLGEKRNLAVGCSNGSYVCVWDDDDWHHENRISTCVKLLMRSDYQSCALSNVLLYDGHTREAYLSASRWGWEATLFCLKSIFENQQFQYRNLDRGEDSPVLYNLKLANLLLPIPNPQLYIYTFHGGNTIQREHWDVNLLQWATKLSPEKSSVVEAIVNSNLSLREASTKLNYFFAPLP